MSDKISNYERTRMMNLANIEENLINEFKADLKKQCVMLMGLPAAGKSTFINKGNLAKYVPGFSQYKISNTDAQLVAMQYSTARNHFSYLQNNVKTENDINTFVKSTKYTNPWRKNTIYVPLTYEWWMENKDKGVRNFYATFNKSYYAIYFDVRDLAVAAEEELFNVKIKTSGNMLIIDTTGSNHNKAHKRFVQAHGEGFTTVVVFLDIDEKYSIARDAYRGEHRGRTVGENVIMGYVGKLKNAWKTYEAELGKSDGYVDRLIHMKWVGGNDPKSGTYKLINDRRSKRDFEAYKKKIKSSRKK